MKFQGTEIFDIQRTAYDNLRGFFGLPAKTVSTIAIALDAAVIFGMLKARERDDDVRVSTEVLIALLADKTNRLKNL